MHVSLVEYALKQNFFFLFEHGLTSAASFFFSFLQRILFFKVVLVWAVIFCSHPIFDRIDTKGYVFDVLAVLQWIEVEQIAVERITVLTYRAFLFVLSSLHASVFPPSSPQESMSCFFLL
jgi:hypothetical protein